MVHANGSYRQKSYPALLDEAINDESSAGEIYRYMANISPNAETANILRAIAADEDRHYNLIRRLASQEEQITGSWLPGGGRPGGPRLAAFTTSGGAAPPSPTTPRLFPKTYGDWVNIAEDIKEKLKGDMEAITYVNHLLQDISGNTPQSEEAKRWLTKKAGELGVY